MRIEIESIRVTPKALIARIKGVTTREAAGALNHTKLYIDRGLLPERDEEAGTMSILIGLAVVDKDGALIGTVAAIQIGACGLHPSRSSRPPRSDRAGALTGYTVPEVDVEAGRIGLVPPGRPVRRTSSRVVDPRAGRNPVNLAPLVEWIALARPGHRWSAHVMTERQPLPWLVLLAGFVALGTAGYSRPGSSAGSTSSMPWRSPIAAFSASHSTPASSLFTVRLMPLIVANLLLISGPLLAPLA